MNKESILKNRDIIKSEKDLNQGLFILSVYVDEKFGK